MIIKWKNFSSQRYYQVLVMKDLFGDFLLTKVWGGSNTSNGRVMHVKLNSEEEVEKTIKKIDRLRTNRGYIRVSA